MEQSREDKIERAAWTLKAIERKIAVFRPLFHTDYRSGRLEQFFLEVKSKYDAGGELEKYEAACQLFANMREINVWLFLLDVLDVTTKLDLYEAEGHQKVRSDRLGLRQKLEQARGLASEFRYVEAMYVCTEICGQIDGNGVARFVGVRAAPQEAKPLPEDLRELKALVYKEVGTLSVHGKVPEEEREGLRASKDILKLEQDADEARQMAITILEKCREIRACLPKA